MHPCPVLIVGAGPSGLALALSLARRGVAFRLISQAEGPGERSRAMVVHARTLEFYRQFGFAEEMVAQGIIAQTGHLRESREDGHGFEVSSFSFKELGGGISPYPFFLAYPQDDHERFLVGKLEATGNNVEWNAKLTGISQDQNCVTATIEHVDGRTEKPTFEYVCGCDGARSQVRQSLDLSFPGGTYEQLYYVADAKLAGGFKADFYANLGDRILSLMLPVRSSGMQRLIGLVPSSLSDRTDLTFDDIRGHVEPLLEIHVTEVNWFSTYRVHHRVAERFRVGRAFLLGDAGHIHSPAGGQGMNTGIGDAINLGWKLAYVLDGRADGALLDSYEPERLGFARQLVATTDRAFTPMVAGGIRGELFRRIVAPLVVTVMTRFAATRHLAFRTLSQTHIHYGDSPLSEGQAGDVHGGDRLPWTGGSGDDNFAPLQSCDWQVHVYGNPDETLARVCGDYGWPLHSFSWTEAARQAGFKQDAVYLVRPDGYVALAAATGAAEKLHAYAERLAFARRGVSEAAPI